MRLHTRGYTQRQPQLFNSTHLTEKGKLFYLYWKQQQQQNNSDPFPKRKKISHLHDCKKEKIAEVHHDSVFPV